MSGSTETKLRKELSLLAVFCIATGTMISSGIFVLPGIAHRHAGAAVFVSYLVAGLLVLPGMLSQSEVVSAMPKAGGDYFYITRALGPAVGMVSGILIWLALALKSAFALIGIGAFASLLMEASGADHDLLMRASAMAFCAAFTGLNLIGVKEAGRFQVALVIGLIAAMALYVAAGLPAIDTRNFHPFTHPEGGVWAIFATAGLVSVSYGGLLKVASIAEETQDPGRTIPQGMILSLSVVTVLYVLAVMVTTGVLGAAELEGSTTPITDGASVFMGRPGYVVMTIAAMLAFVTTANAGVMTSSRIPMALARDGLLPERLGRVNGRFKTPHVAILTTAGVIVVALLFDIEHIVEAASGTLILNYILANLSVIVLRESRLQNYRPVFRAPLYPWLQLVGIVGSGAVLIGMGLTTMTVTASAAVLGFLAYWFFGRREIDREYALLHLVERITSRELTSATLENELKEIIQERDEILEDRFDRIISSCPVMDEQGPMSLDEFLRKAASTLAYFFDMDPEELFREMRAREAESSTALGPDLAIPHLVVPGEGRFDILMARVREGIRFSDAAPSVNTVFVLAGTKDERNFHLVALTAIAQVVQAPEFRQKWTEAKSAQAMRDAVHLAKRLRH